LWFENIPSGNPVSEPSFVVKNEDIGFDLKACQTNRGPLGLATVPRCFAEDLNAERQNVEFQILDVKM
jgi:hypothetical protein